MGRKAEDDGGAVVVSVVVVVGVRLPAKGIGRGGVLKVRGVKAGEGESEGGYLVIDPGGEAQLTVLTLLAWSYEARNDSGVAVEDGGRQ
ncbi:hypothetical protein F4777DRAFT_578895 [Nemania sp. FL0916]|nr:hypothetical protein F4777DRAFT_578895 [Nemania sp. FL0916]